jgi:hypothetical protein
MKMTKSDDHILNDLFAQARGTAQAVPDDLMRRVLADGLAAQPAAPSVAAPNARPPRKYTGLLQAVGGWLGAAGLAGATALGLAIGFMPTAAVQDYGATYFGAYSTLQETGSADYMGLDAIMEDA